MISADVDATIADSKFDYPLLHKKAVSHVINSRALTGEKPCINKAIHALLMHGSRC